MEAADRRVLRREGSCTRLSSSSLLLEHLDLASNRNSNSCLCMKLWRVKLAQYTIDQKSYI
jgi:hypothetical protein